MEAIICPHLDKCPYRPKKSRLKISPEFKEAIITSRKPMYQIAAEAGIAPAILSKAVNGKQFFKSEDEKIKRIAMAIGFNGHCFEN